MLRKNPVNLFRTVLLLGSKDQVIINWIQCAPSLTHLVLFAFERSFARWEAVFQFLLSCIPEVLHHNREDSVARQQARGIWRSARRCLDGGAPCVIDRRTFSARKSIALFWSRRAFLRCRVERWGFVCSKVWMWGCMRCKISKWVTVHYLFSSHLKRSVLQPFR